MGRGVQAGILIGLLVVCLFFAIAFADEASDMYEQAKDLYYQGRYEEALPIIENSLSVNSRSTNSWNLFGLILMNLGRDDEALTAYNKSIELKPTNHLAYNNKGLALKHLGYYDAAIDAFDAALRINPTSTIAYYNKGNLQMQTGDFQGAIKSLESALSYDPHYAQAWNSKGLVYQKTQEHERAVEAFARAVVENPEYKEAWFNKGISLSRLGRDDEALEAFSQALRIDPTYTEARNEREKLSGRRTLNTTTAFSEGDSSQGGESLTMVFLVLVVLTGAGVGLFLSRVHRREPASEMTPQPGSQPDEPGTIREKITVSRELHTAESAGLPSDPTVTEKGAAPPQGSRISGVHPAGESTEDNAAPSPGETKSRSLHHDVFISYSSQDKVVADAVCAAIEARKIRCWIAPRDILPGTMYQEGIIRAIEECRIMVFIFSSHSNNSPHIIRELTKAVSTGAIIIPFRIEDVIPSKSMEYLIGAPHWLDALTPPLEAHIRKLVDTIEVLLEQETRRNQE